MSNTRTLDTTYGNRAVKVAVEGLPEPAARAITEYADTLIRRLNRTRTAAQQRRRAAVRLQIEREHRPLLTLTEAQRLDLARRGELASRSVAAEIYTSYSLGSSVLRLLGRHGSTHFASDVIPLNVGGQPKDGAMTHEVLNAAGEVLARRGFTHARGARWAPYARTGTPHPTHPDTARVPIVPTAAYLSYVERRFGPEPEFSAPDGMPFRRTQRGMWIHTDSSGRTLRLTWSPVLNGDRWRLWDEASAKPRIVGLGQGEHGADEAFANYRTSNGN
ncbi:hypothetical protein AB0G73_14180 [Streptomyces sp. NPDC020719]|uniref:hypothetical protein n=1 Tax=Streptomyces sp. NPDC020719 TaxID=3154896 RepID=UPI0033E58F4B